jgi:hypothetical protein
MTWLRLILVALVSIALAGYAADCAPMASSDEAMQCCETMPCASHTGEHSQDCCKTMPSMQAPFVQAPSMHDAPFSVQLHLVLPVLRETGARDPSARVIVNSWQSSSPPGPDPTNFSPLRI